MHQFPFQNFLKKLDYLIHLVGIEDLYVSADVSENLLPDLKVNNAVRVFFPALNEEIENLSLTRIGKVVNQVNRTIKIESMEGNNDTFPAL